MKLLFDQYLSIVRFGSSQRQMASRSSPKMSIFAEMASLLGSPPKVVWIRTGNQTTAMIAALLRRHVTTIQSFEADDSTVCLEIY